MSDSNPQEITLETLHGDLTELRTESRQGFADLKATLVAGFRSLPGRETAEEMVRLLREANRLQDERLAALDIRIREQHSEVQQALRALLEGQHLLTTEVRTMAGEIRVMAGDMKALIARLDALIKGRGDGSPAP